jgi:Ca-activated chloride channel family protein
MPELSDFHFLRPEWLLGVAGAVALWLLVRSASSLERQWRGVIAPHLLAHLKVGAGGRRRVRPLDIVVVSLALASIGLAGPTWEREETPFSEDTAPLVLALQLSQSMDAIDVAPTRLERAKQKIRDVLARRRGARTALLAYAGTAHVVLPLTDDPSVLETFVTDLATDLMPVPGNEPVRALRLAETMLEKEETPGTILFFTDGIPAEAADAFVAHRDGSGDGDSVMALAFGTSEGGPVRLPDDRFATDAAGRRIVARLDREGLETLADRAGVWVGSATVDQADVDRIDRRMERHLRSAREDDPGARWSDAGYWLSWPVALLALLWFRKGWTVRWGTVVLVGLLLTAGAPASADAAELRFADLWLTPDQQGRYWMERDEPAKAAERFADPMWKGVACYRAGDWENAILQFARVDTAEGWFNLGNAYARSGNNEEAIKAYDEALARRPGWTEAEENRALVVSLIPPPEPESDEEQQGDPHYAPDEIELDEKGKKGKEGEVQQEMLTDEQKAEMWLRRLQATPADFLRRKFAAQAAEAGE